MSAGRILLAAAGRSCCTIKQAPRRASLSTCIALCIFILYVQSQSSWSAPMQKGSYSEDLPHTRSRMTSPKKRIQSPAHCIAYSMHDLRPDPRRRQSLCWCNNDLHGSPSGIRSYAPPARTTLSGVGRNTHSWTVEIASEPTTAIHDHVATTSRVVETTRIS
jgi:hypothetical protein